LWSRAFLDGSFVPTKGEVGKGTKRMPVVDGNGIPPAPSISRAEVKLAQETLERVRVPRRRGRPKKRPERLVADKAYDCDRFRGWLRRKGVIPCVPRGGVAEAGVKDGRMSTRRDGAWRKTFAWLGNFRRPVVRWERLAMMYEAICTLACVIIRLRELLKWLLETVFINQLSQHQPGHRKIDPGSIVWGRYS